MYGFYIPPPWSVGQIIWSKKDGSEWSIINQQDEDYLVQSADKVSSVWLDAPGLEAHFLKTDPSDYAKVKVIAKKDGWIWRDKIEDDD